MTTQTKETHTVHISEKAANQLRKIAQNEGKPQAAVRVAVQGGGCSGLVYKLIMETESKPEDKVWEEHGVKVFVDKKSAIYLVGTELDFSDGLNGKGFVFSNPNAKKACGCGNSFGV